MTVLNQSWNGDFVDAGCFSHTINNGGKQFEHKHVDKFMNGWLKIIDKASGKTAFRDRVGVTPLTYSKTRWWSKFEVLKQVFHQMHHMPSVLEALRSNKSCKESVKKCLAMISNPAFLVQLSALMDGGTIFVAMTYDLEGDGLLAVKAYDSITRLRAACQNFAHHPNLSATAAILQPVDAGARAAVIAEGKACLGTVCRPS